MSWPFRKENNPDLRRHESGFGELKKPQTQELLAQHIGVLQQIFEQQWCEIFENFNLPRLSSNETRITGLRREMILSYCATAENLNLANCLIPTFELKISVFRDEYSGEYLLKYSIIILDTDGSSKFDSNKVLLDEDSQKSFRIKVTEFLDDWILLSQRRVEKEKIETKLFKPKRSAGNGSRSQLWR